VRLAVTDCVTGDAAGEMVADREALRDCDRDGDAARLRDNVAEADLDGGNGVAARERVLVSVDDAAALLDAEIIGVFRPVEELVGVELNENPDDIVVVALAEDELVDELVGVALNV
jgi:hypothetical protein